MKRARAFGLTGSRPPLGAIARVLGTQVLVLAVSLVAAEVGLQLLVRFTPVGGLVGPRANRVIAIPDERLGYRGNPNHPDHDARGYRNARALASADVVTLGDSNTYGISVKREQAWPSVLAARTGLNVYNMAFAGYGPGQITPQWPETLALRPRAVIVGFYFGNDLVDAFIKTDGQAVPPGLVDLVQRAAALERQDPIAQKAARF